MRLPGLVLAFAVLSVSFAAPLFRLAEAPPLAASFYRLLFAVLLLLPFAWPALSQWRLLDPRDAGLLVLSGIALGAHFGLWVTSLFLTSVAASVALVTLQAIFVAIGGHLLGERLTRRAWWGVVIATAGAVTIGGGALLDVSLGRRALLGDVLALLGGLGSAAYMLIGRRVRARVGLVAYVLPVYATGAAVLLLAALLAGEPLVGYAPRSFLFFVLLAAVPMLGGHTAANWVLRHLEAHIVATWILLEPVGAALLAWVLPAIDETPTLWTVAGGLLILYGASLTVRGTPRPAGEPAT